MKRFLIILPILFMLCGCGESVAVNIDVFAENINDEFNTEILNSENIFTQSAENEDVSYWLPDGYDVCCSLFTDSDTGVITKYTVTSEKSNSEYRDFCQNFEKAIYKNNQNITISSIEADNLIITIYEDFRYKTTDETYTLKNEISEFNFMQPVSEKTINNEN